MQFDVYVHKARVALKFQSLILSMEGCAQGAHFLSRRNPDNVPLQGGIVITADFGTSAEFTYFYAKPKKELF